MARTFISLPMDAAVRGAISSIPKPKNGPIRWVGENHFHITLRFLGEVPSGLINGVYEAVDAAARPSYDPIRLSAQGVGAFPNAKRARVVWVGLSGDTDLLDQLQRRVNNELVSRGFPAEERPFKPHVTIGRLKVPAPIPEELVAQSQTSFGSWTVPCIQVMESQLRPSGPIYTVRHEVALPAPP